MGKTKAPTPRKPRELKHSEKCRFRDEEFAKPCPAGWVPPVGSQVLVARKSWVFDQDRDAWHGHATIVKRWMFTMTARSLLVTVVQHTIDKDVVKIRECITKDGEPRHLVCFVTIDSLRPFVAWPDPPEKLAKNRKC